MDGPTESITPQVQLAAWQGVYIVEGSLEK